MKKLVRTLMLAAAMLLPFASHAQTSILTVCNDTVNSDVVPFDGYNADADQHNQMIYPASMLTDMDGESILKMEFYIDASASNGSNTSESRLGTWTVSLGETSATTLSGLDATTTLTQVYQGYFDCSTGTLTIEFDSPYSYNGGNLLVDLNHSAASWNRWYFLGTTTTSDMSYNSYQEESYTFLPKATFTYGQPPACFKVQNATASTVGSNSVTLTWSDTINSGATYTVYNMADTSVVESGITGTTCTITDLTPATNYTFGIGTDCGVNGVANGYATVSVFTNCAPMPLPFSETFDATLNTDPCWRGASIVYAEGVVPTLGNNNNWTYQSSVSNGIEAGHYRVNIYGSSCYKWLVTPGIDLAEATSPLLTFDAAFTKYSGTGAATGFEGNATQKFYVLVSTDGGTTWSILSDVSLSSIASESYVTQYVDLSAYDGDTIRLAFYAQSTTSGGDNNLHLDNIAIAESTGEICYPTTGLTVSNITATSATVTWNSSTVGNYVFYIMNDSSSYMYTDTVADLNTLQPNTEYTVGVTVDCPNGESPMITTSFRTDCGAETLPFSEDFAASLSSNPCWRGASIVYTDSVQVSMGANSNWTYTSSVSNGIEAGHYRVNIYGTSCYKWLITPTIDFTTASSPLLSFDAVFTKYSGTGAATGFESNTSQKFLVLVSTNGGTTWSQAADISLSSIAGAAYTTQFVDLSAYAGENVRIAFYAQSTTSGGDNNLHLDNIAISESTGEICYPTTGLTVSNITATSATVTWNSSTVGNYVLYIMNDSSDYMYTDTVADLNTLQPNTEYTVGVTVDCPSGESPMITTTFRTACANETMPWSENFNSWTSKSPCWSFMSGAYNMGAGTPTAYSSAWTLNSTYGSNIVIDTNALTMNVYSTNRYWAVTPYIEITSDDALLSVDVAVAAWSSATPSYDTDDTLAFAITTDGTNYTTLLVMDNTQLNALTPTYTTLMIPVSGYNDSTVRFAIFAGSAASGGDNRIAIDNVSVTEAPNCLPVVALTVDSTSAESVSLSWTGNAASYNVIDMADGSLAATTTETNVTISGLDASTTYTFGVVADCGGLTSDTVQITAMTACVNTCSITIDGVDAYSDGWNGASIEIRQGVSVVGTFTLDYGNATNSASFTVCDGIPVQFVWMSGSYDDEASFTISDGSTAVVYTCSDGSTLTDGVTFTTIADACPSCIMPEVSVASVTSTSVTLEWVDESNTDATYSIYSADGTVVATGITADNYTITGLTAATNYVFGVVANCSATDASSSALINVRTDCEGGSCLLTIAAQDTYGDGWGSSYLSIIQNGAPVMNYTMAGQGLTSTLIYDTVQVSVCSGMPVSFSWVSGGFSSYDGESSFSILDASGMPILTMDDVTSLTSDSVFFTEADACGTHTPDSVKFTFAVNDATMGTTTPAPGEYYYYVGDDLSLVATANTGYQLAAWTLELATADTTTIQTVPADGITNFFSEDMFGFNTVESFFVDYEFTITATFVPDSVMTDTNEFVLEMAVNNAAMGTVTPAVGTHTYVEGDEVVITATANPGYVLVGWLEEDFVNGVSVYSGEMEAYDSLSVTVDDEMLGLYIRLTALFESDGTMPEDSLVIITAVNDATMGTINPAPGTHVYHAGDYFMVEAIPNEGYHVESWQCIWTYEGEVIYDTTLNIGITQIFPYDTAEYYLGWTMSYTVNFAAGSTPELNDSLFTLVTAVNDATMGTITPAPGTHTYDVGETYNVTATANEGYYLYAYQVNMYVPTLGEILNETIVLDELAADEQAELQEILNYTVEEEMLGAAMTITAVFARSTGINDVEADNFTVSATEGTVVVLGAAGEQVTLFDVNGRVMSREANAGERVEFRVSNSGVYLVKVGNAAAKRVVVIR